MREVDKITTSVMSCQIALNQLESIKHTPYYKQSLKNKINAVLPELIKKESEHFDKFFETDSDATDVVYKVFEDFIKKICTIPIYDMESLSIVIDAFNKDKKSIEGICKKILR